MIIIVEKHRLNKTLHNMSNAGTVNANSRLSIFFICMLVYFRIKNRYNLLKAILKGNVPLSLVRRHCRDNEITNKWRVLAQNPPFIQVARHWLSFKFLWNFYWPNRTFFFSCFFFFVVFLSVCFKKLQYCKIIYFFLQQFQLQ